MKKKINGLKQVLASEKGKMSTQFMSEGQTDNLSTKKTEEESVKVEGFNVTDSSEKVSAGIQQPMAGSEFWVG